MWATTVLYGNSTFAVLAGFNTSGTGIAPGGTLGATSLQPGLTFQGNL